MRAEPGEPAGKPLRVRPLWHLVPCGFLALWIALGVRSLVSGDTRGGWGMFQEHATFRLSYAWILEEGGPEPYTPGAELRGPARILDGSRERSVGSIGALRADVRNYVGYMMDRRARAGAIAFRATLTYRRNGGPAVREVHERPRGGS